MMNTREDNNKSSNLNNIEIKQSYEKEKETVSSDDSVIDIDDTLLPNEFNLNESESSKLKFSLSSKDKKNNLKNTSNIYEV